MRITDRLKAEHGVFLRQLKTLERLIAEGAANAALAIAVGLIADAEEHHSALEDRVLYPALVRILGPAQPALVAVAAEHERLHALTGTIRSGAFGKDDVAEYARVAREHFEHEIHGVFVLAEEWIEADDLERMANWNVDHTHEELGRPAPWDEKR
ncbi:MAG: hemerythrin domain-containing protein [Byssovorax sp.]